MLLRHLNEGLVGELRRAHVRTVRTLARTDKAVKNFLGIDLMRECSCRRLAVWGTLPDKKCRECSGSGYV
jgi:hypothetical protein